MPTSTPPSTTGRQPMSLSSSESAASSIGVSGVVVVSRAPIASFTFAFASR